VIAMVDTDFLLNLNAYQKHAVQSRLDGGIGVIVGPPGTGKTIDAAAEAISAYRDHEEFTLMCALGNATVDEMARALKRLIGDDAKKIAVRTGNKEAVSPNIPIKFETNPYKIADTPIVLTTLHSCRWLPRHYKADRLIIDETGVETLEQTLMPMRYVMDDNNLRASHSPITDIMDLLDAFGVTLTNVGDPLQARPISPRHGDYSAIEYFMRRYYNITLKTTYRLPEPLDQIVDEFAGYRGLHSSEVAKNRRLRLSRIPASYFRKILQPEPVVTFVDVGASHACNERKHGPSSWSNPIEASIVAKICAEAKRCMSSSSIMPVTRYKGQCSAIGRQLKDLGIFDIEARTTTSALGLEDQLVVFSITRNNPEHVVGAIGSLQDLNVAISRPLCKLIIVGSFEMLEDGWMWLPSRYAGGRTSRSRKLAQLIERYGEIVPLPRALG
jgi:hypothetical protein